MRLPLLMPAPSELERAGDPEVACVEANDLVAAVEDAPVARPRTPERDRFDVTSWCYTITGRRHVVPSHLSIAKARLTPPERPRAIKHAALPPKATSVRVVDHVPRKTRLEVRRRTDEEARFARVESDGSGLEASEALAERS
jgi:hypothetical protein